MTLRIQHNQYHCRQLTWADERGYRTFCFNARAHPDWREEMRDTLLTRYIYKLLNTNKRIAFGLFDNDKWIGHTQTDTTDNLFGESLILESHRGRGLSALFYQIRIRYMLDNTDAAEVYANIDPDNEPSLKAAAKAGFIVTGPANDITGELPHTLDLEPLRLDILT